jgi:hypothetical protein
MINPDFEKLFEPYTEHGATLEGTRGWLVKKGARLGIPEQIADQAIAETMLELAGGKTFFEPCACCADTGEAHNAIEHYMRDKMIALHEQGMGAAIRFLEGSLRAAIEAYVRVLAGPGRVKRFWAWLWDAHR